MTSAQNEKSKQINTQHANYQNESIVTNKSTDLSGPAIMEDVEPKVQKMYENITKVIEDWSTSPPNQEKGEVMCYGGMCRIKEGDDQALVR